jgi:phosphatidylserine decarboxylase
MPSLRHQYVERETGRVCTERLYQDRLIRWLYSSVRERAPRVFRALTSGRVSRLFGWLNYDSLLASRLTGSTRFLRELKIDLDECLDPPRTLNTVSKVFQRRIRYWECRPMSEDPRAVISPSDARCLIGSFKDTSQLFVKEKFFAVDELLGPRTQWPARFRYGDFAVLRLTPDKYHYNHAPVSGVVRDFYEVGGAFHSCNPAAAVELVTPYSKNKRVVTIIDTDVPAGSQVGLVAMIEVVALMIGRIEQCCSDARYDDPRPVQVGTFLRRGQPKSLFRPGSSTVILIFAPHRVRFAEDLIWNLHAPADSRFSQGFAQPLVETDLQVRSLLATANDAGTVPGFVPEGDSWKQLSPS